MELAHIEKRRKQRFASLCIIFSLTAIIGFTIVDLIEGDKQEFIVDLVLSALFIASLIALQKIDGHLFLYRAGLALLTLGYFYNVLIGAGEGTAIYWLFPFPLAFLFFLGKKEGAFFSAVFFGILCILLVNPFSLNIYEYDLSVSLRFLASLLFVTLMAYGLEASRERFGAMFIENHTNLLEEKVNLQQALGEIKTLHGLIPICSTCKKIRNDEGYWQQVEVYVRDHTHADFSHGICPDCAEKYYQSTQRIRGEMNRPKADGYTTADRENAESNNKA